MFARENNSFHLIHSIHDGPEYHDLQQIQCEAGNMDQLNRQLG